MILRFTIVPSRLSDAITWILDATKQDPAAVVIPTHDGGSTVLFAGDPGVLAGVTPRDARAFTRLSWSPASGVIHVDLDGYQASFEQARGFVASLLDAVETLHVWDDESGEDLRLLIASSPALLYAVDPEFDPDMGAVSAE